jgi:outer membrane protein assembly factor BamB
VIGVNAIACVPRLAEAPVGERATWATHGGDLAHARSAEETLSTDLEPAWTWDAGRAAAGPIAIGDSVVVAVSTDRRIVVLRRDSGQLIWRARLKGPGASGPLFDDETVYAASGDRRGAVHAYGLLTGKMRWSRAVGPVVGPLALGDATVYAATTAGSVVALDAERGHVRWQRSFAGPLRSGVTHVGVHLLVASDDSLYLVSSDDGHIVASTAADGAPYRPPAIAGTLLVAASPDGIVSGYALRSLERRWSVDVEAPVFGSPAIARDTAFVVTLDGRLWRIPLKAPAWTRIIDLGFTVRAGPTPLRDGVLIGTVAGDIVFLQGEGVEPAWRTAVDGPIEVAPVVDRGTLFVIDGRGTIRLWRSATESREP